MAPPSRSARSIPELLLHLHPFDPGLEPGEEIREELAGVLVGELALCVELGRRARSVRPAAHPRPALGARAERARRPAAPATPKRSPPACPARTGSAAAKPSRSR